MIPFIEYRLRNDAESAAIEGELAGIDFTGDPGYTKQEPAEDADINVLMARFGVTDGSTLPYFPNANALYGDISYFPQDPVLLQEIIRTGDLEFLKLPAELRVRFHNAAGLHGFLTDPDNLQEAINLGLLEKSVSSSTSSVKAELVPNSSKTEQ